MKKVLALVLILVLVSSISFAGGKTLGVTYSEGHFLEGDPIEKGFDVFGYNYNAHMFKGYYINAYLGGDNYPPYMGDAEAYLEDNPGAENHWAWPYRDTWLLMKWNDAWLSNQDRDDDGKLDRHFGYESYIDSGAWETNHMIDEDGTEYFVKIKAATNEMEKENGMWYLNGQEVGPVIWGQFITIQEVTDDGVTYKSPMNAGLGY